MGRTLGISRTRVWVGLRIRIRIRLGRGRRQSGEHHGVRVRPEESENDRIDDGLRHGQARSRIGILGDASVVVDVPPRYHARAQLSSGSMATRKVFHYDRVFGPSSTQEDVYDSVKPLIEAAVLGYNATCFMYGATGSGKTYTISGEDSRPGIVPDL